MIKYIQINLDLEQKLNREIVEFQKEKYPHLNLRAFFIQAVHEKIEREKGNL